MTVSRKDLAPDIYHEVETHMLEQELFESECYEYLQPTSFLHHMARTALRSDVFLFTENSAIPIADAVRGYFDSMGAKKPVIETVRANITLSRVRDLMLKTIDEEAERLKGLLTGKNVMVVDQYVETGETLRMAELTAYKAGAARIYTTDFAQWYWNANPNDISREDISSVHSDFMHSIGQQAAQIQRDSPQLLDGVEPIR